jgi:hypothetical protein
MNFYTKTSARVYAGGTINAYADSNTLTVGATGLLDVTLAGAKIATNTPLMLAISGSFSFSAEWQAGALQFKYVGMEIEQSTAQTDSTLVATKSALSEVRSSKTDLVTEATALVNRGVDLGLYDWMISP